MSLCADAARERRTMRQAGSSMRFKVNEAFHSVQGEGRGPVREREA